MFQRAYQIRVHVYGVFFWGKLYLQRNTEIPSLDTCTHLCNLNPCQDIEHDHHLRKHIPSCPSPGIMIWFFCFPGGSAGKESTCSVGDLGLIPELGRSSGEGNGYPLQYAGLENSVDCIIHGVLRSRTLLSDFHFHCHQRRETLYPSTPNCKLSQ